MKRQKNKFFEFKSVKDVPPNYFAAQFINDLKLPEVESLDQLKWYFDGSKVDGLVKEDFVRILENTDELKTDKVINIFNDFRRSEGIDFRVIDKKNLIEFMRTNDDWFNEIFKVKD